MKSETCPRCGKPVRVQLVMGAKYCWNCGCRLDQVELKKFSKKEQDEFIKKCIKFLNEHKLEGDKKNEFE